MKSIPFFFTVFMLILAACSQPSESSAQKMSKGTASISDYLGTDKYADYDIATFAGGCFWCTEAAFERINGVVDVISGYSGGVEPNPTYEQVGKGQTGHAEAIQIYYDPAVVSFQTLLDVFFVAHDPTQLNRQGPDIGAEYRSAIYFHNEKQKAAVKAAISELNDSGTFTKPIVTEVAAYREFWVAEDYHQDYYEYNPGNPYVQRISKPKVEKVKKVFAEILKPKYKK